MHRNAHHRTTSDWACSWRVTIFRWLKKSYEGHFHNFHRFLSAENKDNKRNNQRPITLRVEELFQLCHPSPQYEAWERRNKVPCIVSAIIMPHSYCNTYAQSCTLLSYLCFQHTFCVKKQTIFKLSPALLLLLRMFISMRHSKNSHEKWPNSLKKS